MAFRYCLRTEGGLVQQLLRVERDSIYALRALQVALLVHLVQQHSGVPVGLELVLWGVLVEVDQVASLASGQDLIIRINRSRGEGYGFV